MDAHQFSPHYPPIRRVNTTRQDLIAKFQIQVLPAFAFLQRTGKSELYQIQPDRKHMMNILRKFFTPEDGTVVVHHTSLNNAKEPSQIRHDVPIVKDQVFMADLEGALLYAFGHEVSIHKVIVGKELDALKQLVNVLSEYFPGRPVMQNALFSLQNSLEQYKQIRGEEFNKLWKEALGERELSPEWVGCRGSRPHFRGYPCSLWTTFHVLTINYALKHPNSSVTKPELILHAMKGFIKYFFGCAHCANHFIDMAEDEVSPIESVKSPKESVLWLWAAHNKVFLKRDFCCYIK